MEEYKKSVAFDDEMHEARVDGYNIGFKDCLKKMKKHYLDLDVSKITLEETDEEDRADEQAKGIPIPVADEPNGSLQEAVDPIMISELAQEHQCVDFVSFHASWKSRLLECNDLLHK